MNILLTGANGFVGRAICESSKFSDFNIIPLVRALKPCSPIGARSIGEFDKNTDFSSVVQGIDVVIHTAARVHVMKDNVEEPFNEYYKVNVVAVKNLASQAAEAGVGRFIYISSVKVVGGSTTGMKPFSEMQAPNPEDDYGKSKHLAEQALKEIADETGLELVIIRPPLVYGPRVKANFKNLLKLSALPFPLPFGMVNNQRSMIYIHNLVDFINCCMTHPKAANQTFMLSDNEDVSFEKLIRSIRIAMNKSVCLFPVPVSFFIYFGKLIGKSNVIDRIVGDLQVDSSKATKLLGWNPPFTFDQGIADTVKYFMNRVD